MSAAVWRVVCEGGEVREVAVEDRGYVSDGRRQYVAGGVYIISESPRVAVVRWCAMEAHEKAVAEIVAPGETTAAERIAAAMHCTPADDDDFVEAVRLLVAERDEARADRDYWREQATGMAPSVDGMRAITSLLIPGGTGCVVDPERAVAAVDALRAIVDGRAEAPADAERAAHSGEWLVRYRAATAVRWWPLDSTGRPCAWPTGGGL